MPNELIEISTQEVQPLLENSILNVRDEVKDNPYIIEALKRNKMHLNKQNSPKC